MFRSIDKKILEKLLSKHIDSIIQYLDPQLLLSSYICMLFTASCHREYMFNSQRKLPCQRGMAYTDKNVSDAVRVAATKLHSVQILAPGGYRKAMHSSC